MTLFISFSVIVLVAALVGRTCARSRPGHHPRASADGGLWPGAVDAVGDAPHRHVELPDVGVRTHRSRARR